MTALIKHGDFDDLTAGLVGSVEGLGDGILPMRALQNVRRDKQPVPLKFRHCSVPRGVALKALHLEHGFEVFLGNMYGADNEIFFLTWGWDLSGQDPVLRPEAGTPAQDLVNQLRAGERVGFLGDGVVVFPAREVAGGISLRVQVWESDQGVRDMGQTLKKVASSVRSSELTSVLSRIASAGGLTTATVTLVKDAAVELAGGIGTILKDNSNDYVDLFEGHWPVSQSWTTGAEDYRGHSCHLELRRLV